MGLISKVYNSPNKYNGRAGWKPDMICDHITAGSFSSAINTFMNKTCEVSSHFIVGKDGTIVQMVPLTDGAWCNGTRVDDSSRSYKVAKSAIVRSRKTNCNYYTVSIEHENLGGGELTEPQLKASIALHIHIIKEVKRLYGVDIPVDREHIIGHYQVANYKPLCPGLLFPWDKLIEGIKAGLAGSTPVAAPTTTTIPTVNPSDNVKKYYKVQCGAFTKKAGAQTIENRLKGDGYKPYLFKQGAYYKVQVGAFSKKANAEALKKELESKCYQAIVVYN